MDIRCHRWNDAALADAGAMVCYGLLQRLLARAFPGRDQQALHNSLLKALPDLVSGIPALKLWDLSRMARADDGLARAVRSRAGGRRARGATRPIPGSARSAMRSTTFSEHWGFRCSARTDADGAEFPGRRRAAHRSAEGLYREGGRRRPPTSWRARSANAIRETRAMLDGAPPPSGVGPSCHSSASQSLSALF